jgi:hypothetical protein
MPASAMNALSCGSARAPYALQICTCRPAVIKTSCRRRREHAEALAARRAERLISASQRAASQPRADTAGIYPSCHV